MKKTASLRSYLLNPSGHFGPYGGRYVPEMLMPIMEELELEFFKALRDKQFLRDLHDLYENFSGRPTPLTFLANLSKKLKGAKIYLKNEGLNLTGAHKINHCLGQVLLAKRLGKTRIIAETGAGQHGLATATVAAKCKLECRIYMGAKDYDRQRPNVFWMERLGAEVIPVHEGGKILKDAISAALRDLMTHPVETHYLLGTVTGPHPYPVMNTFFQSIVGKEVRKQLKKLPDNLVACVGGGSNAMGLFYDFLDEPSVRMIVVEAGGKGIRGKNGIFDHAARFQQGEMGVAEGFKSLFLQDSYGQIGETHSISAGLDYAGVGPQIAYLKDIRRIHSTFAKDQEALKAFEMLAREEGIFPALESAHAAAEVIKLAPQLSPEKTIVFNCSGRGDKDLFITTQHFDKKNFNSFLKRFV